MTNLARTFTLTLLVSCTGVTDPTSDDSSKATSADDKGDSPTAQNASSPLRGIAWSRYQRHMQSDHLYNGTLFGMEADVWILGAYKQGSCDVDQKIRYGCVYDYVMVEVGPLGRAAGRHAGDLAGTIVYNETPGLVPGYSSSERVVFSDTFIYDDSGSFTVGDTQSFIQAKVHVDGQELIAEWQDPDPTAPFPGFRWETTGGTAFREKLCPASQMIYPGQRCAAYCTEGGVHPDYPECPLFPH
jgi:hypothetical protein